MLPLILAGLAGATITAIGFYVADEEENDDTETVDILDKATQTLNQSRQVITDQQAYIDELQETIISLIENKIDTIQIPMNNIQQIKF